MSPLPPIVIFGESTFASLVWYCLTQDARRRVAGFTVDRAYQQKVSHEGLPVVPFETLEASFPPGDFELIVPIGAARINGVRKERCRGAKERGYRLASYVSGSARVWAGLDVKENCLIFENAVVQPFAQLGENVTVRAGANIGHHNVIGDDSFIATGAVFGGNVATGGRVFVGLGAVVRDGLHVADRTLVGAGAVLTANTEPDGVYVGSPARRQAKSALEATGG